MKLGKVVCASILVSLLTIFIGTHALATKVSAKPDLLVHNIDTGLDYATIQEAIDAPETLDGHTIFVEEGTYYEHVVVNKSISLVGKNRSKTIIDGNSTGIVLNITANNVDISGFTVRKSGTWPNCGIYVGESSVDNNISYNIITNNYDGISFKGSSYNSISENTIAANARDGIMIYEGSYNNTISINNITDGSSNGITLKDSSNNTVYGNNITNNKISGINIYFSSHNTVSGNNITDNFYGVALQSSPLNTFSTNKMTNNKDGVFLHTSSQNTISLNNITNNERRGVVLLSSNNNTVSRNTITNNTEFGIRLYQASNNTISGNSITNNINGAWFIFSSNNKFHHNNFIDNIHQVYFEVSGHVNFWDNGVEGNYWSDYEGVDSNYDGIADTTHVIDGINQDNFPLMGMFSSFNISLGYHVNVISNSTIKDYEYFESNSTIRMYVSNMTPTQTHGFCRVCISKDLMSPPYEVIIDDGSTKILHFNDTLYDNVTHRWIYFTYEDSKHKVDIIPEFPSVMVLPLFIAILLIAVILRKNKPKSNSTQ